MPIQELLVCAECIDEPGIKGYILQQQLDGNCSFCVLGSAAVASLDNLTRYMKICVESEFDDAADWLIIDQETGNSVIHIADTWDLLTEVLELEFPNDTNYRLLNEIIDRLPDRTWCDLNPHELPFRENDRYEWARFCEVVMHRRRYFFSDYGEDVGYDDYSPGQILDRIFRDSETYGLFRSLPAGTSLFRARFQGPGAEFTTPEDLGPPPRSLAVRPNRMSPPGIPMLYVCDDPETGLRETAHDGGQFVVGRFRTQRQALILDLSNVPPVPSLFHSHPDAEGFSRRRALSFLNHVADEIARPVEPDGLAHIQYVPTQVVTEYVRSSLTNKGLRVDGVKYLSAAHPGHASYVIFSHQENLVSSEEIAGSYLEDEWLELTCVREYHLEKEDVDLWKEAIPRRYGGDYQQQLYGDS